MQKQDYKTVREIADIAVYLGDADVISFDFETSPTEEYRDLDYAALDAHNMGEIGDFATARLRRA